MVMPRLLSEEKQHDIVLLGKDYHIELKMERATVSIGFAELLLYYFLFSFLFTKTPVFKGKCYDEKI